MPRIDKRKAQGFAAAYEDGMTHLVAVVELAIDGVEDLDARLSAGLRAALDLLAARPALAHLLLVESLATAGPARLKYERVLSQVAALLRQPPSGSEGGAVISEETARLLAGGLAAHLSGRVLAGEAATLRESHELLLSYLLAALRPAAAVERRVALA